MSIELVNLAHSKKCININNYAKTVFPEGSTFKTVLVNHIGFVTYCCTGVIIGTTDDGDEITEAVSLISEYSIIVEIINTIIYVFHVTRDSGQRLNVYNIYESVNLMANMYLPKVLNTVRYDKGVYAYTTSDADHRNISVYAITEDSYSSIIHITNVVNLIGRFVCSGDDHKVLPLSYDYAVYKPAFVIGRVCCFINYAYYIVYDDYRLTLWIMSSDKVLIKKFDNLDIKYASIAMIIFSKEEKTYAVPVCDIEHIEAVDYSYSTQSEDSEEAIVRHEDLALIDNEEFLRDKEIPAHINEVEYILYKSHDTALINFLSA